MLRPQHPPPGRLILPILIALCASLLSAQAHAPRKLRAQPHSRQLAAIAEGTEGPRTIAFVRTAPLPTRELSSAYKAYRQIDKRLSARESVNLSLLLPSSGTLASWASTSWVPTRSTSARQSADVFAPDPPPPSTDLPARFNDVQFYTRHIPGIAPIVDRFFQEKNAHPQIVRVLQYLHPKF